jgi:two-component system probable response regulator PhcQ
VSNAAGRKAARPVTLLIVDDEPVILKALRRIVRDDGYQVFTAGDGEDALRIVSSEAVDIVLSDLDMPGISGIDLMVRLRRNHPGVVRLLLTGRATVSAAVAAINDGEVFRFLTKPWDVDELREVLRQAAARVAETRAATTTGGHVESRTARLLALESDHPGITQVTLNNGVYRIDPARLKATLATLQSPALSDLLEPRES